MKKMADSRPFLRRSLPGFLLSLTVLVSASVGEAQQGTSPADIAILRHSLYRDPDIVRLYQRAVAAEEDGALLEAMTIYQNILASGSDSVLWSTESVPGSAPLATAQSRFRSVRGEVRKRLETLSEEEPGLYEQSQEPQAAILLKEARKSGSQAALEEVVRRFFETRAGFRAVEQLATQRLDQNSPEEAARLFSQLLKSRVHRKRINRRIIRKACCALSLCQQPDAARQLLQESLQFGLPAAALPRIEQAVAVATAAFQQSARESRWATPYGDSAHNGSTTGTVPWLNPLWSQELSWKKPFEALASWERRQVADELQLVGTVVSPLIVNGQLIVRDYEGVRSVDPRTGALNWRYDSRLSAPRFGEALRAAQYTQSDDGIASFAWYGNTMLGQLTSDGERVFAVDMLSFATESGSHDIEARNRLVALKVPATDPDATFRAAAVDPEVVWQAGGFDDSSSSPLSGHLFLGPPLPRGGVLFAVTESRRELNLVKLDAATGRVVWIQRYGLVERPLFDKSESYRAMSAALPAFSDGIVVCQTGTGLVVGIDALFGEIVWATHCGDLVRSPFRGSSTTLSKRRHGFAGTSTPPVIFQQCVVLLPAVSSQIHCIDLATGIRNWSVPRGDTVYVGCVTDHGVLVVEKNAIRLLALETGQELWKQPIGISSGRGVRTGDRFMLPLKSGAVTVIDLATGDTKAQADRLHEMDLVTTTGNLLSDPDQLDLREFGLASQHLQSTLRPGNLLLHEGLVISTGPRHITVFGQAEALTRELYSKNAAASEIETQVLTAQLELSTGRVEMAEKRLTKLLSRGDIGRLSKARRVLQELLFRQLQGERSQLTREQRLHMIEALEKLAMSPDEQQRVFVERTRFDVERENWEQAIPAARRLAIADTASFVNLSTDSRTAIRTDVWGQSVLASASHDSHWKVLQERDVALLDADPSTQSLRNFLRLYPATDHSCRVRNRLADRLIREGQFQEAELLLLENRNRAAGESRAVSELLLVSLWSQLGLHGEAGIALADFHQKYAETPLPSIVRDQLMTLTDRLSLRAGSATASSRRPDGRMMLETFEASSPTRGVFESLQPLPWTVSRVVVRKFSLTDTRPDLGAIWTSGRLLNTGKRSGFDLLRRGTVNRTDWLMVDRFGGADRGHIAMPGRTSLPVSTQYRMVGHFMPVGSPAQLNGISLLEHQDHSPLWELRFPRVTSHELVEAGPATPSVCVFQTKKHLIGVHPATGRVLWRKSDLDLSSGIYVDKEAGLFGDDELLVMFHADQKSWTKLSAETGQVLETGTLDVEFRYLRYVFGRKLFHVMKNRPDQTDKRIRIWDPKTNSFDFDEQIDGRFYVSRTTDNSLLALLKPVRINTRGEKDDQGLVHGRLRVFEMPDVNVTADVWLTPDQMEGVSALRVFADDETLFINTQRTVNLAAQKKYHYLATDSTLPADHVQQGSLIAIDRGSGQILWSQHCRQRTFLRLDRTRLPFLVSLSRVRPRNRTNIHGIELEAIDRRTGEILGNHPQLIPDRFVHTRMNRESGVLQLFGLTSRVDLDFSRKTQQILLEQEPL